MTVRRTLTLASAAALLSVPAWAVSSEASPSHGTATAPGQTKDADEHGARQGNSGTHGQSGTHGKSHKCKAHGVAFVVSGTLGTQELKETGVGVFGGPIELTAITRTNHHAKNIKAPFKETLTNVQVTFGNLADTNADGTVAIDDVAKGDEVKLIGKVTTLAKKCDQTGFKPEITIRKVIFSAPPSP
jgi:hypothetical protein